MSVIESTRTEEDAWQDLLDQDRGHLPYFCDWLADREDPREEGYRALLRLGKAPGRLAGANRYWFWKTVSGGDGQDALYDGEWFNAFTSLYDGNPYWLTGADSLWTRRIADNCAAIAWTQLSETTKEGILNGR